MLNADKRCRLCTDCQKPQEQVPSKEMCKHLVPLPVGIHNLTLQAGPYLCPWCEIDRRQARIDALMLEYCPGEMSAEQRQEWAKHQKPAHEREPPHCSTCECWKADVERTAQPPGDG